MATDEMRVTGDASRGIPALTAPENDPLSSGSSSSLSSPGKPNMGYVPNNMVDSDDQPKPH